MALFDYQLELEHKQNKLQALFAPFYTDNLDVYASSAFSYRMRLEFRLWHDGDALDYVVFDSNLKQRFKIYESAIGNTLINSYMSLLIRALKAHRVMRDKIFRLDFLSSNQNELIVTLIYHKKLDASFLDIARSFATSFPLLSFVFRAHKQSFVIGRSFVTDVFKVRDRLLHYRSYENSFSQPNSYMNECMLNWVYNCALKYQLSGRLLELFCGNGNFSIALSPLFNSVVATELAKLSVLSCQANIALNRIENMSVEVVPFKAMPVFLAEHYSETQFDVLLVDPPRAGIGLPGVKFAQAFDHIFYISCNPHSLVDEMALFSQTHRIVKMAFFDQFPQTPHMEVGVYLEKVI